MILPKYLFVLTGVLGCYAAPASNAAKPPDHCGEPLRFPDKELTGTWNELYYPPATKASYICIPGFIRQGTITYVCLEGKWEGLGIPGQCKKRSCGHPGDIQFGSFELKNEEQFVFGAIVEYTCDNGYQMVTRYKTRECTATGWTARPPICEVRQCPTVEVDNNVNILYTSQDEEHSVGQVVRFECKEAGEKLHGPSEIYCTSEGQWDKDPPTCKEITCLPPQINHGKPKIGSTNIFTVKQQIDYECDKGYKPSRTPQATCTAEGWSPVPMCDEIFCNPEHVFRGKIQKPKQVYREGETATLLCEDGYEPEGNPKELRKCTSRGWSPSLKCISQKCSKPDIQNGKILDGWFNSWYYKTSYFPMDVGDYFYFACNKGFVSPNKKKLDITYCRREGWSLQPTCTKPCSIPSGENIHYFTSSGPFYEGDKMWFRCIQGYETQDGRIEAQIECVNGRFPEENCFKFCKKPYIGNGFLNITRTKLEIGSALTFTCNEGFYSKNKRHKDISECTNAGWKPVPQCEEIICKLKDKDYKSGDVLHFKCNHDEKLEGQNSSQCFYYGWGPKVPVCKGKYPDSKNSTFTPLFIKKDALPDSKCPPAFPPPNAEVKYLNNSEQEAEIQCNPGYILEGPAKFSCQNGKWQSPSMCSPKKPCPRPPAIANSEIIDDPNEYYSESTVKYRCNDGYHMITSDTCTCIHGRWVTPPTCKENSCGKAEEIENGNVNSDKTEYKHGEHAIYECSEGFKLTGNAAMCNRGKWVYIPKCINTRCAGPPQISNGKVLGSIQEKYNTGQHVEYQCNAGYSMKGDLNYVTCKDSQWTEKPVCRKTGQSCGIPPPVNFGDTIERKQTSYPSGSSITYVCIHLYKLEGNEKIKCNDGEWEKEPICRVPCTATKSDMELNNIRLKYTKVKKIYSEHFDNMTFECLSGFGISDIKLLRIQCLDGKLNYPKCFKEGFCLLDQSQMSKNNIRNRNGDVVENGNSINFECDEGMRPENSLKTTCKDGRINYPKCISSWPCIDPQISNANINPQKEKYSSGFSVDIDCKDPYVINGPKSITCNDGQWSGLPECLRPCTLSAETLNEKNLELESKEDLSKNHQHDADVNVKCKENFKRPRVPQAICNNGKMKYEKCFSGRYCKIVQEKLDSNHLLLDERHDNEVYYGENETVYFTCKHGTKPPIDLNGKCAMLDNSQDVQLNYPKCLAATSS